MTRSFAFSRLPLAFAATLLVGALSLPGATFGQVSDDKLGDPKAVPAAKESDSPQKSDDKKPADKKPGDKQSQEKKPGDRKQDDKKPVQKPSPDDKKPAAAKADDDKSTEKKPDREAVAAAFAEEHYPELASLLRTLKNMSPEAYETAVRDVARNAERLEGTKDRDPERYERELDVWKTRSRVHVVSAEYRLNPGSDLEARLRESMQDELRAKRALLAFEREKTARRLEQLDQELKQLDEKGADMIDRQIERLPQSPASKSKPKPKTSPTKTAPN